MKPDEQNATALEPVRSHALLSAGIARLFAGQSETIKVVENPKFTKNLFGPISEIAGKRLKLLERNSYGDCLCVFEGVAGQNIVDVDHRDVCG